ncbi:MAG: TlpA disulfide reductase family protein, partial [Proteobacteria bacterium]|nr:TlpA disulfide reductase family protein [Pseudomonadota bacterium]
TWCEPCREEIPGLQRLREKYVGKNVEVVGIAVDSVTKVRDYATQFKIAYPLVVGGMETIELARSLGNKAGGLPFTIVLDSRSAIVLSHLGLIKEQELDRKLADLVR